MKKKLIPVDREQCQCEIPNGYNFMTFGGKPELIRCTHKATVVIQEQEVNPLDKKRGSMSVCDTCLGMAVRTLGKDHFIIKEKL